MATFVTTRRRPDGARAFDLMVGEWSIGMLRLERVGAAWRWRLIDASGALGDFARMSEALGAMHARLGNRRPEA